MQKRGNACWESKQQTSTVGSLKGAEENKQVIFLSSGRCSSISACKYHKEKSKIILEVRFKMREGKRELKRFWNLKPSFAHHDHRYTTDNGKHSEKWEALWPTRKILWDLELDIQLPFTYFYIIDVHSFILWTLLFFWNKNTIKFFTD